MFVRIASATERIFSASTQRSRRPTAGLSALCLALAAAQAIPALALTRQEIMAKRVQRAAMAHSQTRTVAAAAPVEKEAATPATAERLDFGQLKAGETSPEKQATFTFNRTVTLGKIDVVSMGAANKDFKATGTGTCEVNRTYKAGDSCTVGVKVTPKYAGEGKGAVVLRDLEGTPLGVHALFDSVSGGQLIFLPGTDSAISANANTTIPPTTPAVNTPTSASDPDSVWYQPEAIAVDGGGNVWVADSVLDSLYKIPYSSGSYSTPVLIDGDGLCSPYGVAVDGSGNVYVANADLTGSNFQNNDCSANVIEYPDGSTSGKKTIGVTNDFQSPNGVAVDGSGNVYVADFGLSTNSGNGVWKITSSATVQIGGTNTGPGNNNPYGVAVDSSGNVYVAVWSVFNGDGNPTQGSVYKLKWNGGNSYTESLVGSAFVSPTGIALDPAGDLYVSDDDFVANTPAGFIYKFTPNGSGFNSPTKLISGLTVSGTTLAQFSPQDVAIDESGNLIILNAISNSSVTYYGFYKVDVTDPPSFSYGNQTVNTASAAQTASLANIGNATLDYSVSLADLPTGYILGSGNTCSDTSLASSASCTLAIEFEPTVGGGTAQNGDVVLTGTQEIALTGAGTGGGPVVTTDPTNVSVPAGGTATFTAAASGTPAPTVQWQVSTNGGSSFSNISGATSTTLSVTGTTVSENGYEYRAVFTNSVSSATTTAGTLTVTGTAPSITSADNKTFTVGSAGSFTVTTGGTPTPAISESGALPSGVTFVDNGNGTATLAGTPSANTGGTYSLTITANNGVSPNATQSFTLTVDQAPSITSGNNTTFTVGTAGSFTATGAGYPAPTFSETGLLPSGVTLSSAGVLSGTPAAGTGGSYPITITASNGISPNAAQTFTLTVDQAPSITSANNTTFTVGTAGSFTATGTGYPAPTFSETGLLPSGVTFSSAGVLSGTPAAGTGGTYTISITASNGIGSNATQTFTLTVDQAPAITSGNSTTFTIGSAGSFTVTTTGYPTAALSESGVLPTGVTFVDNGNGTATLAGTPTALGSFPITITAANGTVPNATQSFTLTVSGIAPTITSAASTTFTVNSAGSFTVTTTGNPTPSLSETGALPTGVTFVDNGNGTATLSGTPTQGGSFPITITANNGVSSSFKRNLFKSNDAPVGASQSFTLTVNPASQIISFPAPVIEPVYVGGSAALSATSTSGLPVGFLSATTSVCTVSGSVGSSWTVNFMAIGECSIEAYQWGNSNYAIAPQVFQGFYVHGLTQTISVTPITGTITAGSAVGISASATSSLPVSFTSKTPTICVVTNVVGWQLVASAKGTCTIVATQAGNATYTAAPAVTTSITIHGQTQTISFPAIVEPVTAGTSVTLGATASSGLPVTYASTHTAICTVSESGGVWSANLLTAGTCSIVAAQSGSTTYASAPNVNQNFYVHPTP
jgi:hypothetical protein